MQWIKHTDADKAPPRNRPLLAYCPEWNESRYEVVRWTGYAFMSELHDTALTDYVQQWALILEAD